MAIFRGYFFRGYFLRGYFQASAWLSFVFRGYFSVAIFLTWQSLRGYCQAYHGLRSETLNVDMAGCTNRPSKEIL